MEPARSIGKLGFKRWYERQLIEAHAWFVSWFLCLIAIVALMEGLSFRKPFLELMPTLGSMFIAALIGWYALRRYGALLREAEYFAERSTCASCRTYAAFNVISEYPNRLRVRCRKCSHEWQI